MEHRHQDRGTVDHRGVDDLPLARLLRLEQRARDAEREEHAATAEVANQVEGRHRRTINVADVREAPCEGDVVDVVARPCGVRAILAPAGHPTEHELRVSRLALLGADAQPLHHAGPEALDERIRGLDELQHRLDPIGVLEIDRDRTAAAAHHIGKGRRPLAVRSLHAIDSHHVGAHVGQQHRAEGAGADARDLDDAVPRQRSGHVALLQRSICVERRRLGVIAATLRRLRPVPCWVHEHR